MSNEHRTAPDRQEGVHTYEPTSTEGFSREPRRAGALGYADPIYDRSTAIIAPTDRVRWGPIFAGLFAALSTLIVLSILGLAVGLTSYDAGDPLRNFGIGAGIWGAISTLVAFLLGGWLAARTAAAAGRGNGVLNGAMVWIVAIPLILYLVSSGLGSLLNTAGSVAATGVTALAPAAGALADDAAAQPGVAATAEAAGGDLAAQAEATVSVLGEAVTPANVEATANDASTAAWSTLVGLLLGLGASALGGLLGARRQPSVTQTVAA